VGAQNGGKKFFCDKIPKTSLHPIFGRGGGGSEKQKTNNLKNRLLRTVSCDTFSKWLYLSKKDEQKTNNLKHRLLRTVSCDTFFKMAIFVEKR